MSHRYPHFGYISCTNQFPTRGQDTFYLRLTSYNTCVGGRTRPTGVSTLSPNDPHGSLPRHDERLPSMRRWYRPAEEQLDDMLLSAINELISSATHGPISTEAARGSPSCWCGRWSTAVSRLWETTLAQAKLTDEGSVDDSSPPIAVGRKLSIIIRSAKKKRTSLTRFPGQDHVMRPDVDKVDSLVVLWHKSAVFLMPAYCTCTGT